MNIELSYIIATRNRLDFLQITLQKLIDIRRENEEIIVIDGDSMDGSKEYLQKLYNDGKIHQLLSETDRNQAHAWNKGMMLAKGVIIKKIIDDDVHDYNAIRTCKDFMLENPDIDVCISNSLKCNLTNPEHITEESRLPWYKRWKSGEIKIFSFGDVHLLIRRASLSFIGLYDTQFKMLDWEYSLRISYHNAKIAYFTGCNSLSVTTPGNVSSTATKKQLNYEGAIGKAKYGYPGDRSEISFYSRFKIAMGTLLNKLRSKPKTNSTIPPQKELKEIYNFLYRTLEKYNKDHTAEIIGGA